MNIHTALTIVDGRPVVSSRTVAEYFGKRHDHVLRDIEDLLKKAPELRGPNFGDTFEIRHIGNTERKTPVYYMDRKGFCLLAMGFTGPKALEFKCAFYDEFTRMEDELSKNFVSRLPCMKDYLKAYAIYEQGKAIASQAGKTLSQWGRIKQPTEAQLRIMEDQIQLRSSLNPLPEARAGRLPTCRKTAKVIGDSLLAVGESTCRPIRPPGLTRRAFYHGSTHDQTYQSTKRRHRRHRVALRR